VSPSQQIAKLLTFTASVPNVLLDTSRPPPEDARESLFPSLLTTAPSMVTSMPKVNSTPSGFTDAKRSVLSAKVDTMLMPVTFVEFCPLTVSLLTLMENVQSVLRDADLLQLELV
jgi:hypothetical protein